jgi:hypothetical protein
MGYPQRHGVIVRRHRERRGVLFPICSLSLSRARRLCNFLQTPFLWLYQRGIAGLPAARPACGSRAESLHESWRDSVWSRKQQAQVCQV